MQGEGEKGVAGAGGGGLVRKEKGGGDTGLKGRRLIHFISLVERWRQAGFPETISAHGKQPSYSTAGWGLVIIQ